MITSIGMLSVIGWVFGCRALGLLGVGHWVLVRCLALGGNGGYPPSTAGGVHRGWRLSRGLAARGSEKVHEDKSYSRGAPRAAQARALIRSAE